MCPDAQLGFGPVGPKSGEHVDPELDVLALQAADLVRVGAVEAVEVAVLDADDVGVREGEVDVEADERVQRGRGVGDLVRGASPSVEEPTARVGEDRGEHRGLAREVAVHGGAGHARGLPEFLEGDSRVPAVGEEPCGGSEQRGATVGLGSAAFGERLGQGCLGGSRGSFGE
ncbi:hypothetical protein GCM10025870_05370 [Agromyces marinus]|uniref:Uncharacterized protein n=1 Tax=Agromyces marinus TaxID=1389020 RepID=A0ABN6Y832_9MICO|nr:hypothetical protein GCM10025870_05370 [Agromyces marinus]